MHWFMQEDAGDGSTVTPTRNMRVSASTFGVHVGVAYRSLVVVESSCSAVTGGVH